MNDRTTILVGTLRTGMTTKSEGARKKIWEVEDQSLGRCGSRKSRRVGCPRLRVGMDFDNNRHNLWDVQLDLRYQCKCRPIKPSSSRSRTESNRGIPARLGCSTRSNSPLPGIINTLHPRISLDLKPATIRPLRRDRSICSLWRLLCPRSSSQSINDRSRRIHLLINLPRLCPVV